MTTYAGYVQKDSAQNPVVSKTKGMGIKIDPSSPVFGWRDILGDIHVRTAGSNDPTLTTFRNGIRIYAFSNSVMNEVFLFFHIPHDYLPGSDIYVHVHWAQNVVDSGGTAGAPGDVKWQFESTYSKGHNQAAIPATVTTSVTATASAVQYQHMLTEVQLTAASPGAGQLDSDDIEVDGIIMMRFFRNPADVADTLNQVPFVMYCDLHYQSTGLPTKNKAPDFWT